MFCFLQVDGGLGDLKLCSSLLPSLPASQGALCAFPAHQDILLMSLGLQPAEPVSQVGFGLCSTQMHFHHMMLFPRGRCNYQVT